MASTKRKPRRLYPDDFKQEAVQRLPDGYPDSSVAERLGVAHLGVAVVIGCLYVNHREWLKRPLSAHSLFKSQLKHCIVERRETYLRKSIHDEPC
jgi:hypothetical protein